MPRPVHLPPLLSSGFMPPLPLAVGYSGGADSTALLAAAHARWPGQVVAIHVNHGLQAAAAEFEAHCAATCSSWGIPLQVARVNAHARPGQSPEDAARRARWRAFVALSRPAEPSTGAGSNVDLLPVFREKYPSVDVNTTFDAAKRGVIGVAWPGFSSLALAQHADDQAETLLLALSRGAGLGGLSGMPAQTVRDGLTLYRPLLGTRRSEIRAWLASRGLHWVEDPSNQSLVFTRNRIRAQALPALESALPGFAALSARSALHLAQAQALLQELAESDLQLTGVPPEIRKLQALTPARQANALRHWLARHCGTQASTVQLGELQKQISACQTRGHRIGIKVGTGQVQRLGDRLAFATSVP